MYYVLKKTDAAFCRDEMEALTSIFEAVNAMNVTCSEASKCLAMVEGKCLWFKKDKKKEKHKEAQGLV
jgi:hypothetical protein